MEGMNWNAGDAKLFNDIITPISQARSDRQSKRTEAAILKRNANAALAKGTREAEETRRKGKVLASNARARMGASGGVTDDAGAVEQLGSIKHVTDYNALSQLFDAETQSDSLRYRAKLKNREGDMAFNHGMRKSVATVLKNSDKLFGDRFNAKNT